MIFPTVGKGSEVVKVVSPTLLPKASLGLSEPNLGLPWPDLGFLEPGLGP